MINIVINYDPAQEMYKIYEPTTDTLLVSANLTEALVSLNAFLISQGWTKEDILHENNIIYHLDSPTVVAMVTGNLELMKRLNQAPSGFMLSEHKFGISQQSSTGNGNTDKKTKRKGNRLAGAKGFNNAYKKFGN